MKRVLILAAALFCQSVPAQDTASKHTAAQEDYTVYTSTEVAPQFPGGTAEFYKYLEANTTATKSSGRTIMSFVVEKDGALSTIELYGPSAKELTPSITRILEASPKWTPARQNGIIVRCRMMMPLAPPATKK